MKIILSFLFLESSILAFAQFQINTVNVITNDLVYSKVTNKIYVSIPSSKGSDGNSIGIINPSTYILEKTVFIGSEPTEMAISDNGEYIYTGFSGSATVRRFNIATKTAELQFPLGNDSFSGPYYAYDLSVVPGNSHAVAVSRVVKNSSGFFGVAVYDDGVARPITTISTFPNHNSYVINFKNPTLMFGINNHTTGYDFNKLAIDNDGVKEISNTGGVNSGWSTNNFVINNNSVYFDSGTVVDVTK